MRLMRLLCLGTAAAGLACGGGSTGTTGGGGPTANEVWMQNSAFNPATRTVAAGTAVTFTNKDGTTHTVDFSSMPAGAAVTNSGNVAGSGTVLRTFTVVGTYQYFCNIHGSPGAGMNGTITVN